MSTLFHLVVFAFVFLALCAGSYFYSTNKRYKLKLRLAHLCESNNRDIIRDIKPPVSATVLLCHKHYKTPTAIISRNRLIKIIIADRKPPRRDVSSPVTIDYVAFRSITNRRAHTLAIVAKKVKDKVKLHFNKLIKLMERKGDTYDYSERR